MPTTYTIRRCASLGDTQKTSQLTDQSQHQQFLLRFQALTQGSQPLHQYAHRVLGMASRLAWAGYPIKASDKIDVLLAGLNDVHEDMRQLLLTKARRWKWSSEVVEEEEVFERLVALIRFYAFDREGETETETEATPASLTSPTFSDPIVLSDGSRSSMSSGTTTWDDEATIRQATAPLHSPSSAATSTSEKSTPALVAGKGMVKSSTAASLDIAAILGF